MKEHTSSHEHRSHAVLSASASKQWINCPPSARLQEGFPNESSPYAQEGTFMHEVGEFKIRHDYLHEDVQRPVSEEWDSAEVEQVTDIYYDFVVSTIEDLKKSGSEPLLFIEAKLDYSHIAPSGFGIGDVVIIGETPEGQGVIHVIDLKAGKGVFVDADHNSQLMLYALGALKAYGYIWNIELIRMTIVQPRLENVSTFECTRAELEDWGESIKPIARMAYEGKGEQKTGDWCRFCRAKPRCQACADEALALVRSEFVDLDAQENGAFSEDIRASPEEVSPEEKACADTELPVFKQPALIPLPALERILPTLNRISAWIEAVFAYLSFEAIRHGLKVKGYKVVEGRSHRTFTDLDAVAKTATENGFTDIYKKELIPLTGFEKMMGKKKFVELLGKFVVKPRGKLSFVPESDPRESVENGGAEQDFEVLAEQEE